MHLSRQTFVGKLMSQLFNTLSRFAIPLEEGMATHCSVLARRIPMDRGVWQATSPWGRKESDTTEQLKHSTDLP